MRNVLLIGHHEVRLFLRERAAYIWLLVVPLAFTWFMSFTVRGPGGPADAQPAVVIDNQDTGFMGRVFLKELGEQGISIVTPEESGNARLGVTVPADFTTHILAKEKTELGLFVIEGTDNGMAEIVRIRLWCALLALHVRLARHAIDYDGAAPTEDALVALIDAPDPVTLQSSHAGRKPRPVGFNFSLPGNLVGYLFLNLLIFGGASVAQERRHGLLRRTAVHPVTPGQLVLGKIYGLVLLAGVQIGVLLGVGQFALGVNVAQNLPGILLTLLVFSWVAASVGVLIGFLVRAEDKVIGLCLAIALPTVALGGCWWPLEFGPPLFRHLAHAVPTGWALDAMHQFITFGAGLSSVILPLAVLTGFGIVANFTAIRFFRV